jgi:hypothetical protein
MARAIAEFLSKTEKKLGFLALHFQGHHCQKWKYVAHPLSLIPPTHPFFHAPPNGHMETTSTHHSHATLYITARPYLHSLPTSFIFSDPGLGFRIGVHRLLAKGPIFYPNDECLCVFFFFLNSGWLPVPPNGH